MDEARYFIKNLHPYLDDGILWPVLDLEAGSALGKSALSSWTRTFCQEVERLTAVKPIVYMGRSFAETYIEADLTTYPLWIAVPNTTPGDTNFELGPWPAWTLQQYSWTGTVPGIAGDVDLDAFIGDMADLQTYVLPPPTHVITNASVSPALAVRGRTVTLTGNITCSKSRQLLLGASIYPTGTTTGNTSDPAHDGIITLTQGSTTATCSLALPSTLAAGNYDLWLALYLDLNNSGTIDIGDIAVGSIFKKTAALQVFAIEFMTPGLLLRASLQRVLRPILTTMVRTISWNTPSVVCRICRTQEHSAWRSLVHRPCNQTRYESLSPAPPERI